jgi:hypothetical protein
MAAKKKARRKSQKTVAPGTTFNRAIERAEKSMERAEAKIASANSKLARMAERLDKAKARVSAATGKAKENAKAAAAKARAEVQGAKQAIKGAAAEHKQAATWLAQLRTRATRLEAAAARELGKLETALAKKLRAMARPKRRRAKKARTESTGLPFPAGFSPPHTRSRYNKGRRCLRMPPADLRAPSARWRLAAHSPRVRRTVMLSPAIPQLSVSTSSITTTVVFGFLPSTSTSNCVAPSIRACFCSRVAPSRVILMLT